MGHKESRGSLPKSNDQQENWLKASCTFPEAYCTVDLREGFRGQSVSLFAGSNLVIPQAPDPLGSQVFLTNFRRADELGLEEGLSDGVQGDTGGLGVRGVGGVGGVGGVMFGWFPFLVRFSHGPKSRTLLF